MTDREVSQLLDLLEPDDNFVILFRIAIIGTIGSILWFMLPILLWDNLSWFLCSILSFAFFFTLSYSTWGAIKGQEELSKEIKNFLFRNKATQN